MTREREDAGPRPPVAAERPKGKKNAGALSAALRANLQRRKARERALREGAVSEQKPVSGEDAGEINSEVKWIK